MSDVRVAEVISETSDAVSLVLDAELSYEPGQFLTFRLPNGLERCYSLSSSPYTGEKPTVTVKRMPGGACSSWICSSVVAGTVLEARDPAGVFTPSSLDRDLVLFAGGSGITPVMSIIKSVLAAGSGRMVLFYANRDPSSVIFAAELRRLAAEHPARLQVTHWLECLQGIPSRAQLEAWASSFDAREAFVCGPGPFMDAVVSVLPSARVERFDVFQEEITETGDSSTVDVSLDGVRKRLAWPSHKRLLDVLLDSGLDAPYSCRQGQCSACACRIVRGEVRLLHNEVLDDDDLAEGYALACQALPVTDEVEVTYED
ncbi:ferredoxin--NADP reductase [Kutzneria sp. 744]|uniref:ferredoxin--NADP reductase n=1 Tax=Kutzneria sp. (strain 744) TaxID=345341 RepID=UPI0003EEB7C3|nr:ferredoxin--NADP reductase [Kutzneria sp. 744]EWM17921.1 ketosteroid-9-alpha-hydroxylase, reductase kshB [Kutzneria sp. 744]